MISTYTNVNWTPWIVERCFEGCANFLVTGNARRLGVVEVLANRLKTIGKITTS